MLKASKSVSNQRNGSIPFKNQTLCSFHRVRLSDIFLVRGTTVHPQTLELFLQDFQKLPQKFGKGNCSTWLMKNVCKKVYSRPNGLFWRFCWKGLACSYSAITTTHFFLRVCPRIFFATVLKFRSTNNNLSNFWGSKFQQIRTYTFFSWENRFTRKRKCDSPINLLATKNLVVQVLKK